MMKKGMWGMVDGVALVILGVLWWLTNYDVLDASLWDWLLPLVVVLAGLKCLWWCHGGNDCCEGGECQSHGEKAMS